MNLESYISSGVNLLLALVVSVSILALVCYGIGLIMATWNEFFPKKPVEQQAPVPSGRATEVHEYHPTQIAVPASKIIAMVRVLDAAYWAGDHNSTTGLGEACGIVRAFTDEWGLGHIEDTTPKEARN